MLSIGHVSRRTGLTVSAIRYYESEGLLTVGRNSGGQRRYHATDIRRLSFIKICQNLGYTIREIQGFLSNLPNARTPTQTDWAGMSRVMKQDLDQRIRQMTVLRDKLDGCIGCGCLSLKNCAIHNPDDRAFENGAGPRFLITA